MAEVVLFHSALGLRPGVMAAADRPRAVGHTVHTPDYHDAEVFDDLDEGLRKRDELGHDEIYRRTREAVADLPAGLVFAGFSLGAVPAELLASARAGAQGAVLVHAAVPVEELGGFGVGRWPEGVPVQVHYAADEPWVEAEESDALQGRVRGARLSRIGPPTRRPGPARVRLRLVRGDVATGPRLPGSGRCPALGRRAPVAGRAAAVPPEPRGPHLPGIFPGGGWCCSLKSL